MSRAQTKAVTVLTLRTTLDVLTLREEAHPHHGSVETVLACSRCLATLDAAIARLRAMDRAPR